MRRRLAALLIVPALALTACGGGGDSKKDDSAASKSASPSAGPSAPASPPAVPKPVDTADPMPTVAGAAGKKATITLPKGDPTDKFVVHTVSKGGGTEVKKGDLVLADFTVKVWKGGKDLGSSYDKGAAPQVIPAGAQNVIPAFSDGVVGQKLGSRVLVVAPPNAGFGPQGSEQLGVSGTDTLVFVLDLEKVIPTQAEGSQSSIPKDLPQVKAGKGVAATISVPKSNPPSALVSKTIVEGKGATVKNGQSVYMQYTGATWKPNEGKPAATPFDDSWKTGAPFATTIGTKQVIEGWDKGLVGKKVGSRVLLVIPPALGYKDQAQGDTIPANSTLVFVVEILAAV